MLLLFVSFTVVSLKRLTMHSMQLQYILITSIWNQLKALSYRSVLSIAQPSQKRSISSHGLAEWIRPSFLEGKPPFTSPRLWHKSTAIVLVLQISPSPSHHPPLLFSLFLLLERRMLEEPGREITPSVYCHFHSCQQQTNTNKCMCVVKNTRLSKPKRSILNLRDV